jgi:pyridoxal phosphate enzyme (YggS family)
MKSSDLQKLLETIKPEARLVAVTKGHSWEECLPLYREGIRDFGENRLQEALPKMEEAPLGARWHFIGTLQKNKVSKVAGRFALIHSVDSFELAEKISKTAPQAILLQVNIRHKHGFTPDELRKDFEALMALPNLSIQGLMTMAPDTEDTAVIRDTFRTLRKLRDELGLKELSMGMSHDWQIALEEGATLLRIGTLLFS